MLREAILMDANLENAKLEGAATEDRDPTEELMALITYLTRIQFDFGAIKLLPDELNLFGIKRPLIVTDKGVVQRVVHGVQAAIGVKPAGVYDKTPANPTERASVEGAGLYRSSAPMGSSPSAGLGPMDLAKAVALLATHDGPLRQYAMVEGGVPRITAKVAPVIAIPTTAGGSEVGRGAVIVFDDHHKLGVISPHLIPKLALCDPELTLGLPASLTAATGVDAFAHCVETFLAPAIQPAGGGDRSGWRKARRQCFQTRSCERRRPRGALELMMAAMEGAMAFQERASVPFMPCRIRSAAWRG